MVQLDDDRRIRVGVSSCLVGERVRFDGGHKRDRFLTEVLGHYVSFVPVCPEIEIGMEIPRPPLQLEGEVVHPRMVDPSNNNDWTARMNRYARARVRQADMIDLSGFILKNNSPSCGVKRVKLYLPDGPIVRRGVGLFARALIDRYPGLPVEEVERLTDARRRENFIVRVFAYHRLQLLYDQPLRRDRMVAFHSAHKYLLLAHSPILYRELGRLVAGIASLSPSRFRNEYRVLFMKALAYQSTTKKNVIVLHRISGQLKKVFEPTEKSDVHQAIADYAAGLVPLIVPITLLVHFVGKYDIEHIRDQIYLRPHPIELMLRNHA